MNNVYNPIILPVILPLLTAIVLVLAGNNIRLQRTLAFLSHSYLFGFTIYLVGLVNSRGILITRASDWPPPFGIILVADLFSSIMVAVSTLISLAALVFSFATIDPERERFFYYPLWFLLLMGINGSFLTGDIFNLFVFFEVLLIASYILMCLGGEPYQLQETIKYMSLNIVASTLFLVSVGVLYSVAGTLNMADLAVKLGSTEKTGLVTVISMMFLAVFGIKAAIFPLYFWLPRSYFPPPSAVTAVFGGLLTKVGVYAIIRVFTLLFIREPWYTHNIILVLAGLTMFLGVLGAISQMDFKRILSYHIISQIGYMIMGLGLFSKLAVAGAVFYIVHHIIVKSCLFLVSGVTEQITGTTDLRKMGGILGPYPFVAALFFIAGLSLAGVPPFSGFFSKFVLVKEGLSQGRYFIVFVSILVSLLTLFSMMKIYMAVYWGERKELGQSRFSWSMLPPVMTLVALTIFLGLNAEWIFGYAMSSAEQLMNPQLYIAAVLGKG